MIRFPRYLYDQISNVVFKPYINLTSPSLLVPQITITFPLLPMASMISSMSSVKSYGFPPGVGVSGIARISPIFGIPRVSTKKTKTATVNVATDLPGIQSPLEKEMVEDRKLVAWTSVRQERWEGELVVEGEIPKWLV